MIQIIDSIFSVFAEIIGSILDAIFSLMDKDQGNEYSAKFVSPNTILSIFNYGYSLTGGLRATTRDMAYKGALVVGPSGSGKTSTVLLGSIFTLARGKASMCILDVSGELFKLASGYLNKIGYKIYCINFGNTSDSFNCLLLCICITDIQKVAFLLIKNSGIESKNDPYWSSSAEMMLAVFIEYLVFYASKELCTMSYLVELTDLFAGNPSEVDALFVKTPPALFSKYRAMNAAPDRTLQSTLATVRTSIKIFGTPAIKTCTATNTIDFASFRKTKSVLFFCTPLNDVNFYAPLSALVFEELFKEILSRIPDPKKEHSIFCLIDEMVTMKFKNLGLVFANCRKYAAGCMGVIQDEKMLEMGLSQAESYAVKINSYSKVYLPGQPHLTCKNLEEILGKTSFRDPKTNVEKVRWLKSSAEIRMSKKAIILVGNKPPIEASMISYFDHWKFRRYTQIPPYVLMPKSTHP